MTVEQATATRVHLEGGQYVRVTQTIGEVADMIDDERMGGWVSVEDPGDGRGKLIRASRVLWIEEEAETDD